MAPTVRRRVRGMSGTEQEREETDRTEVGAKESLCTRDWGTL
jgi:hypothetical protein